MLTFKKFLLIPFLMVISTDAFAQPGDLEIFREEYPRAGYFRPAEFSIRNHYQNVPGGFKLWAERFSDLSGIMGKTEYEELLRDNPYETIYTWFKRFKARYPEKFVIVHMNGRGRIPNYKIGKFSAGHWLYFEGSDVNTTIFGGNSPMFSEEVWLEVEDPSHFRMDNGMKNNTPDDITLVARKPDGSLDWDYSEYVRLIEIEGNRILVRRAMFGSKPRKFEAGRYYAAPHIMGGPWEKTANMVWYYNLSTQCPKDRDGNTCADILIKEYSDNFRKGGRWETFDGVQFDVMTSIPTTGYHEHRKALGQRADINLDGIQDDGIIDGVQTFGTGGFDYITRLRAAVGKDKIIATDGREHGCQRIGNQSLNGVEMEGVPEQRPFGFITWSTTFNLLEFWKDRVQEPRFNYGAFRYNNPERLSADEMLQYYRLAFAQSVFTDSFILCGSWTSGDAYPDMHELFSLRDDEPSFGWLGKPLGPTEHLMPAQNKYPDVCISEGKDSSVEKTGDGITRVIPSSSEGTFSFTIKDIPYDRPVTVEMTIREDGVSKRYPKGYNRQLEIIPNGINTRYMKILSSICETPFRYRFYFCDTYDYMTDKQLTFDPDGKKTLDLEFSISDSDLPIEVSDVLVSDKPEILIRHFEKGTVIANLTDKPFHSEEYNITVNSKDAAFIRK
jgi:hypothetical protein